MQNIHKNIYMGAFVEYNGKKYACSVESNGLFMIDESNNAQLVGFFPDEQSYKRFLIADGLLIDDRIVFAPESAEYIYVYDIKKEEFLKIEFNLSVAAKGYDPMFKFSKIAAFEEWIYIFPATYPFVLKLNKFTLEIIYLPVDINGKEYWFRKQCVIVDKTIFFVSYNSPYVFSFDFASGEMKNYNFSNTDDGGMSIIYFKKNIWIISSTETKLYRISIKSSEVTEYPLSFSNYKVKKMERPFSAGVLWDKSIIIVPLGGNMVLKFDLIKESFYDFKIDGLLDEEHVLAYQFQSEKEILFYRRGSNIWNSKRDYVLLNIENLETKNIHFKINNFSDYKKCLIEKVGLGNEHIEESNLVGVTEFINLIGRKSNDLNSTLSNAGRNIFDYIKF